MPRRPEKRPFGTIRRLPSGYYQARYTSLSGERVTAPGTYTSRMDAEAWLREERRLSEDVETWKPPKIRLEEKRREEAARRPPRFQDYAERWIETRRSSRGEPLRPTTKDAYRSSLRRHVYPTFGALTLDQITRAAVRQWHADLQAGPTARSHAYTTMRTILNTAVDEDELLEKNPVRIRGAGIQARRKNLRPASPGELRVMVEAMPERLQLFLLLATWCALRSGELRELRRKDMMLGLDGAGTPIGAVNVSRGYFRARSNEEAGGGRTIAMVGLPKTDAGIRSVSIPDFLLPQVAEHLARFAAPGSEGLLFPSALDPEAHLSDTTLNGRAALLDPNGRMRRAGFGWREARRLAGRSDLSLHDLRHTGASMAGEEGASLAELMYRLGHSTPSMAIHYQHSSRERDQELGRRLSARHLQSVPTGVLGDSKTTAS